MSRPLIVFGLVWVLLWAWTPTRGADAGPTDAEVNQAISRGLDYVKSQREPQGNWVYSFNHTHDLGITALAGLALLENGVERSDPVITSADEVIRTLAPRSNQSYDLALAILFMARVQPESRGKNDVMIRRLAARLDGGEQGGMWTYTVPLKPREDDEERASDREKAESRRRRAKSGDNSNTQFALLGMWAGGRHEFDPNDALEAIDRHFRESQNEDGRWGYVPGASGTRSMTCAGLMGMAIGAARPQ
ncbi:prenyltransferase/squalene oxidase repeat-containing protein, partial [Singulisphaera rosea]